MICTAVILSISSSTQSLLGINLPKRLRCGNSFLAFGQGSRRKACFERY